MNTHAAHISVIIPCKNDTHNLQNLLNCLMKCDPSPFETIVIDDGSDQPISDCISNSQIQIHRLKESRGPAFARNKGVELATSEIVLFLDSDVIVGTDIIFRVSESFYKHSEIAAVQGIYDRTILDNGLPTCYQNLYYVFAFTSLHPFGSAVCATFCFAVKREVFLEAGGFDISIPYPTVEDEAFGYVLAAMDRTIFFDRELKVRHLAHYSIRQFIRRKFRMSFFQINHFLKERNQLLRQIAGGRKNPTHHSFATLLSIVLAPALLLSPIFHWSFALFWSCLYLSCNAKFWGFCSRDQHLARMLGIITLTWIDHLTITFGLVFGTLHYLLSPRS